MNKHVSIAELADALHRSDDPVKAMAILNAFFDDSGDSHSKYVTAVGGFVGSKSVQSALESDWKQALSDYKIRYGVTWFHAADINKWQKEWQHVPLDICRLAPMQFATVLSKLNIMPVWSAVVNDDFYKYATPEFLARFPDPIDLCFHDVAGHLYHWSRAHPRATKIIPCIAHGDYASRIIAAHQRYRDDGDFQQFIGPLAIDSPRSLVPLQAADLLANEFYNWWVETEFPQNAGHYVDRPVLHKAMEYNRDAQLGSCYSGDGMRLAVERYMKKRQAIS